MKIGDYWDEYIVDKVVELLREYQDLFTIKFLDLKGILQDLIVMNIYFRSKCEAYKIMTLLFKSQIQ